MFKHVISISLLVASSSAFAYGLGQVTMPTGESHHSIGAEVLGIVNKGAGLGVQGRYLWRANEELSLDAGAGLSGGDRSNRFFVGSDYMLLPDYENQPRISVKGQIENAEEFGKRRNILSLAPTVSKGFYVKGYEAYPFIALPVGLNLNSDNQTYKTSVQVNLGLSGKIPFEGMNQYIAHLEGNINLKDSYNSVALGMSYPIP